MNRFLLSVCIASLSIVSYAADPYIHVLSGGGSIASVRIDETSEITHHIEPNGSYKVIISRPDNEPLILNGYDAQHWWVAPEVPQIKINTSPSIPEIIDKENYLNAHITIDSRGRGSDFEGDVNIRGRGNSSWYDPKKPYRLKFDKKTSVLGYKKAKSYVLVANWTDPSMLRNIIATKAAQLLDMPYTNTITPVEVTFNNIYKGTYLFTEKVGMNSGSVDLTEGEDAMFEIDSYFDENLRFISDAYELPVMYKEDGITDEQFKFWRDDFNSFESTLLRSAQGDKDAIAELSKLLDMEQAAKYLLVNNIAGNHEIMYPKSLYIYKPRDGKYSLGPVWDFDWGFGHDPKASDVLIEMIEDKDIPDCCYGYQFFMDIVKHPDFKPIYKKVWEDFRDNKLKALYDYIDSYAQMTAASNMRSIQAWEWLQPNYMESRLEIMNWLKRRLELIDDANANYYLF